MASWSGTTTGSAPLIGENLIEACFLLENGLLSFEGRQTDVESLTLDFYNLALRERYGSLTSAPAWVEWDGRLKQQLAMRPFVSWNLRRPFPKSTSGRSPISAGSWPQRRGRK